MDVERERPIVVPLVLQCPLCGVQSVRIASSRHPPAWSMVFRLSRSPRLLELSRIRSLAPARWVEFNRVRIAVSIPRGRGHISTHGGRAIIVARCPLCGEEHRYDKGKASGEEVESIRRRGYTEEWLPCQNDLPGNFWRILISSTRQSRVTDSTRRSRDTRTR